MANLPQWASTLSGTLASLCLELDTDEFHIFRHDVVASFPALKDQYVEKCPRRTDFTTMRKKATDLGYVTVHDGAEETTTQKSRRGANIVYVQSPKDAIAAFFRDVQLMHDNCVAFNGPQSPYATVAEDLLQRATVRLRDLEAEFSAATPVLSSAASSAAQLPPKSAVVKQEPVADGAVDAALPAPTKRPPTIRLSMKNASAARPKEEGTAAAASSSSSSRAPPQQPSRPQPPPRVVEPEPSAIMINVPYRLRAMCVEDFELACTERKNGRSAHSWLVDPLLEWMTHHQDVQSSTPLRSPPAAFEVIGERYNELQRRQVLSARQLLDQFVANIGRLAAKGGVASRGHEITAEFVATSRAVVERVLLPFFNDVVTTVALTPEERFDAHAFVAVGLVQPLGDSERVSGNPTPGGAPKLPRADWATVFGPRQLVRVLMFAPAALCAVLDKYLPGDGGKKAASPSDVKVPSAAAAVNRNIVPVIEVLLDFIDGVCDTLWSTRRPSG